MPEAQKKSSNVFGEHWVCPPGYRKKKLVEKKKIPVCTNLRFLTKHQTEVPCPSQKLSEVTPQSFRVHRLPGSKQHGRVHYLKTGSTLFQNRWGSVKRRAVQRWIRIYHWPKASPNPNSCTEMQNDVRDSPETALKHRMGQWNTAWGEKDISSFHTCFLFREHGKCFSLSKWLLRFAASPRSTPPTPASHTERAADSDPWLFCVSSLLLRTDACSWPVWCKRDGYTYLQ